MKLSLYHIAGYDTTIKLPADSPWHFALEFAERGFKVFPCGPNSKEPAGWIVRNGVKDATTDRATILSWATRIPNGNYGIAMGDGVGLCQGSWTGPRLLIKRLVLLDGGR